MDILVIDDDRLDREAIPVILLSARREKRDIESGRQAGAQDYVTKPFLPDDLLGLRLKLLKSADA